MRWPSLIVFALIVILQYPLWLGKGGWLRVWDLRNQLAEQRQTNQRLEARNTALDEEVRDLKSGLTAIEERARFELGLVKKGELFIQTPLAAAPSQQAAAAPGVAKSTGTQPAAPSRK